MSECEVEHNEINITDIIIEDILVDTAEFIDGRIFEWAESEADGQLNEIDIPCVVTMMKFEHAGLMTRDRGFVIGFSDGREFQVTIVRSK